MLGTPIASKLGFSLVLLVVGGWLAACAPAAPPTAPTKPASAPPAAPAQPGAAAPAGPAPQATAMPMVTPARVAVAYSARSANTTPLWLAYEHGYFAEQGIEAELSFLSSTMSGQGLIANSVQFGLIGSEGIDLNLEAGSQVTKYVAGVTPKLVFKLVSVPEINSVQDLRGKVVGATRQGAVTDYALRKVLLQHGLQPDTDVAFIYPGTIEATLTALLTGHIQAIAAGIPNDLQATQQGMKVLVDIEKQNIPFLMAGVIVRTDYASEHPAVVERFLKAHLRGVATTLQDPEAAQDVMGKYLQVEDRALLRYAYDTFRPTWTRDQLMPEETIVASLGESRKPGARTADPKDFYDNSYLERLKQSGYIDGLYARPGR